MRKKIEEKIGAPKKEQLYGNMYWILVILRVLTVPLWQMIVNGFKEYHENHVHNRRKTLLMTIDSRSVENLESQEAVD